MTTHPLHTITTEVETHARTARVATVFDIDSTLFCVAPRTEAILRALARDVAFAAAEPVLARALSRVEVGPHEYGLREIIGRLGVTPGASATRAVKYFWHSRFFSNDHLDYDVVYPSAAAYVNHLDRRGATVLYLTGRGDSTMRPGTERQLLEHGFPLTPGHLLMKPTDHLSDEGFKAGALREIAARFDHVWFFENEPVIIHEVRTRVPAVRVVFVRSAHSGIAPDPTGVPEIEPNYEGGLPPISKPGGTA